MTITLSASDPDILHRQLAQFNVARVAIAMPSPQWKGDLLTELEYGNADGHYLEFLRSQAVSMRPRQMLDGEQFVAWFESLHHIGPGQQHSLFDLHAALDVSHSRAWNREIIRPLVDAEPQCAQFIAAGALMRLLCGERCFERYSMALQPDQLNCPQHWLPSAQSLSSGLPC